MKGETELKKNIPIYWEDRKTGHIFIADKDSNSTKRTEPKIDPKTGFVVGSKEYINYYFPSLSDDSKIDQRTGFVVGSQGYNDYYFPKIEKPGRHR